MASPIDILINAFWRGRGDVDQAKRDLRGLGPAGERGAQGLETLDRASQRTAQSSRSLIATWGQVTIAIGAVTIAAKQLFERLESGAGLELTTQRFDRLAESIGSTGVALRSDLLDATDGLLSTSQSMALATDLIALGLAKTHDEAVRLARVVTELDADMGELTLALANQTTRRFDQLGISLEGFNERLGRLKETMSDEDAFSMAFLEQAEAQIERVGGVSQTTAGDIRRLQADWAALNEEIDIFLAKEFGPILAAASGRTAQEFRDRAQQAIEEADSVNDLQAAYRDLERQLEELGEIDPQAGTIASVGFRDAQLQFLQAVAEMSDSAEDFEATSRQIFGPPGIDIFNTFGAALRRSGAENAEAFYEMARAIQEGASADRVLIQAHQDLIGVNDDVTESLEGISETLETIIEQWEKGARAADDFSRRLEQLNQGVGIGVTPGLNAEQEQQRELDQQSLQDRVELFDGFQESLSDIADREGEQRAQIEEQYESRRTELVEDYSRQRTEEEEDWQRRRLRQEEQLQRDIAGVRDNTAERQAELRDDANRRIQELEEDHLQRMADITQDASLSLEEAAGRLDSTAIQRITRQRDQALEEEEENYQDQRETIEDELERRLQAEQEAAEERIRELQAFHERRQREEAEDRDIRLQRQQEAHERALAALDEGQQARLDKLAAQAREETDLLVDKYTEQRNELTADLSERAEIERQHRETILSAEEAWWARREALATGATGGTQRGGGQGGGGAMGGGQGGFNQPVGAGDRQSQAGPSLNVAEITVNAGAGQDPQAVGEEVVVQIDRYMQRLLGGPR